MRGDKGTVEYLARRRARLSGIERAFYPAPFKGSS